MIKTKPVSRLCSLDDEDEACMSWCFLDDKDKADDENEVDDEDEGCLGARSMMKTK